MFPAAASTLVTGFTDYGMLIRLTGSAHLGRSLRRGEGVITL
jgi:hypothetical protein